MTTRFENCRFDNRFENCVSWIGQGTTKAWIEPRRVQCAKCAYCGRLPLESRYSNCEGCGAPLSFPAERQRLDVTTLASKDREYIEIPQPEPMKK